MLAAVVWYDAQQLFCWLFLDVEVSPQKNRATPSYHMSSSIRWDVPSQKPSSPWGSPGFPTLRINAALDALDAQGRRALTMESTRLVIFFSAGPGTSCFDVENLRHVGNQRKIWEDSLKMDQHEGWRLGKSSN